MKSYSSFRLLLFTIISVAVILAEVERRFGVAIEVPDALAQRRLGLYLKRPETAETVLDAVCGFLECRFRATPNGYELFE